MPKKIQGKKPPKIQVSIDGVTGYTPEPFRKQGAINMKLDPKLREKVEMVLAEEKGSIEAGLAESKRRYPEAYEKD